VGAPTQRISFGAENSRSASPLLANNLDLDQSRTPSVLYHQIGLGLEFLPALECGQKISRREWQKHLSVTLVDVGWLRFERPDLRLARAATHASLNWSTLAAVV